MIRYNITVLMDNTSANKCMFSYLKNPTFYLKSILNRPLCAHTFFYKKFAFVHYVH
jgi:hypothetical protein